MAETWATTNEGGRQASDWAELDKLVRCSAHGSGTAESTAGPTAGSAPRKVGKRLEERVCLGGSRAAGREGTHRREQASERVSLISVSPLLEAKARPPSLDLDLQGLGGEQGLY